MRSYYITKLNNLDDWFIAKVSAKKSFFEIYMKSNNKKMVCRIVSPTYWAYKKWQMFISNTDEFDGQWSKSPLNLWFDDFNEMKDHINLINTEVRLGFDNKNGQWVTYKEDV